MTFPINPQLPSNGNEISDLTWMNRALALAHQAQSCGEVPVGAVLVKANQLIATGYNTVIERCDPTAHAEIQAIRQAGQELNNYRLIGTTLYVTLEPCAMCAAAIVQARIQRVVFGAFDPRLGAGGSLFNLLHHSAFNHQVQITSKLLERECSELLKNFFKAKRKPQQEPLA